MSLVKMIPVCVALLSWGAAVGAWQASTLTPQDRADIQELVAKYQRALTTCASQEYASLFVPDGVFISDDFRGKRHRAMYGPNGGKLVGRAKLAELVETEDFCLDTSQKRAVRASTPPTVVIEPAPGGAKGTIALANNGRYEDEYVKTSEGWRFKGTQGGDADTAFNTGREVDHMSGVRRVTAVVLAILVVIPVIAAAQASITGVVTDESGGVLPGVTVEASSPGPIEKVRAVVTDSTGRYRVVDLRPGDYAVTASLPGFASVRREGITLVGTFTATVDMKLGVGNLQETVTVTGESPIVDVQSVSAQRSIDKQVIDAIPAGRNHIQDGVLIPGVTSGTRDVGGTRTLALTSMAIHGGRQSDQRVMVDGLVVRNVGSTGSLTNLFPDMSSTQEITIDYGAVSAETMSGGVRINYVPQQGGNSLSGRFFGTFVNQKFQADNFSDELRASGLREPNSLNRAYDVNPSIGGAIVTDKVWFYGAARFQENNFFLAGNYYNLNAGDPTKWTYDPDFSRQALDWITQKAGNGRMTWQVSEKHKVSVHYEQQSRDIWSGNPLIAPESTGNFMFPKNSFATVGWTAPLSSRLLLEVRGAHRAEEILVACPGQTPERDEFRPGESPEFDTLIPVREQALGNFLYRGKGDHNPDPIFHCNHQDIPHMMQAAGTLSYVTGTHAFKVGIENFWGTQRQSNGDVASATSYRFNNAIPNQITQRATPFVDLRTSIPAEMGVFVQDKWTVNRLTLTGGLRFDYFKTIFREMHLGPSPNVPNRDFLIPESTWYDFKDLSPRIGAAYDIFGTGRTAAKVSLNRYVTAINALDGNPVLNFAHVVTRSWGDNDRDYDPRLRPAQPADQRRMRNDLRPSLRSADSKHGGR